MKITVSYPFVTQGVPKGQRERFSLVHTATDSFALEVFHVGAGAERVLSWRRKRLSPEFPYDVAKGGDFSELGDMEAGASETTDRVVYKAEGRFFTPVVLVGNSSIPYTSSILMKGAVTALLASDALSQAALADRDPSIPKTYRPGKMKNTATAFLAQPDIADSSSACDADAIHVARLRANSLVSSLAVVDKVLCREVFEPFYAVRRMNHDGSLLQITVVLDEEVPEATIGVYPLGQMQEAIDFATRLGKLVPAVDFGFSDYVTNQLDSQRAVDLTLLAVARDMDHRFRNNHIHEFVTSRLMNHVLYTMPLEDIVAARDIAKALEEVGSPGMTEDTRTLLLDVLRRVDAMEHSPFHRRDGVTLHCVLERQDDLPVVIDDVLHGNGYR